MYIQGKYLSMQDDLSEVEEILDEVFLKEQKKEKVKIDEYESCLYCIVYEEKNNSYPVATGMVYMNDQYEYYLDHIAVRREYRNKYYGDMVVRMLLNKVFTSGLSQVYLTCPREISAFFKKIGFKEISNTNLEESIQYLIITSSEICSKCKKDK